MYTIIVLFFVALSTSFTRVVMRADFIWKELDGL